MRKYLSVEVEHTRQARFLPLEQAGENKISLTTLADFQKRAEVKIFLIHEGQRILLHTFEVQRLPKKQAGEPRLVLKGTYDGKGNVRLSISVDGRHYSSTSISIKKYTRKRVWWPWVLLLALLLLGASAWLFLRSCTTTGTMLNPSVQGPTSTSNTEQSTAAESESVAQPQNQSQAKSQDGYSEQAPDTEQADEQQESATEVTEMSQSTEPEQAAESEQTSAPPADQEQKDRSAADRPAVDLSQNVYFGPDSSELSPEARRALSRFAEELQDYNQLSLRIEGHCALYGTEQGREELSYDRAQRVAQYFRELGYSFDEEPVIIGRGGDEPVSRNNDEQHLNRRVVISTIQPD